MSVHLNKKNLELGAACGTFGHAFIPDCLITEKDKERCDEICKPSYVEYFCDALDTKLPDNWFTEIYACNPHGYGFQNYDDSELFLKEIARIIKNNGKLVILSTIRNTFGAPHKVKRAIERVKIKGVEFECIEKPIEERFLGHKFVMFANQFQKETNPNYQIEIYVRK